jgi:hypothetical protein
MNTPNPTRVLRLVDLVILTLDEGRKVTAQQVARRWGEDRVRVQGVLDSLAKSGLCKAHLVTPAARKGGKTPLPYKEYRIYPFRVRRVADLIRAGFEGRN